MNLKINFNAIGTTPVPFPDGTILNTFGIFQIDEHDNVHTYIGTFEDGRTVRYDKKNNKTILYTAEDAYSSIIIDKILETIARIPKSTKSVSDKFKPALGM